MIDDAFERLRAIALALPEAVDDETSRGSHLFKVAGKLFLFRHRAEGRACCSFKVPDGTREARIAADPARCFVPPYTGRHGWLGVWLDVPLDWDELAAMIEESYRLTAPKRLVAALDARERGEHDG